MKEEKRIGKIQSISFGMGGYDDAMLGVSFTFGSDKDCWRVGDFKGTWANEPSERAEWTIKDQTETWGKMVREIGELLKEAKVNDFQKLKGVPVEVTFEENRLKSWRVMTECI